MRAVLFTLSLVFLVACLPQGPTGNAVAPPTHFEDGSQVLVRAVVGEPTLGVYPVRVDVLGDRVYSTILVNGEVYSLSGEVASGGWLVNRGSRMVFLEEGSHTVHAFSCVEGFLGWKCGCRSVDDCGHWMERTVVVR